MSESICRMRALGNLEEGFTKVKRKEVGVAFFGRSNLGRGSSGQWKSDEDDQGCSLSLSSGKI